MNYTPLVFSFEEYFSHKLQHAKAFVAKHQFHPSKPRPRNRREKLPQLAFSSFIPSAAPKTSPHSPSLTTIAARIVIFSNYLPQLQRRQIPSA